ncbi:hypothetical protein [Salmonirosea aquatica]|uniref:Uncharacterized protein n=1 Tax=Salmonirosea aquatica TaxID=2654236 RepID=A0A7C9FDL9_9BACT|nr:hypothetical protein [Cytophagaceae bacterium SJW1-29]
MTEDQIPVAAIENLKSKFPNAQEIIYKTVEDKLWEATFVENGKNYYSALDTNGVLVSYVLLNTVPSGTFSSILEKVSLPKGEFSNFRENTSVSISNNAQELSAKYTLDSTAYLFSWFPLDASRKKYVVQMRYFSKFDYTTNLVSNLPVRAQNIIKDNALIHKNARIFVNEANEKTYESLEHDAANNQLDYIFDHRGNSIYSSRNFQGTYAKTAEFPQFAQDYMAAHAQQFTNFPIQSGVKFEESGQVGYRFILYRAYPFLETYYLYFNNSGTLTYLTYEALVTP